MKIHNYHFATGEYLSTSNADESPLELGNFLIPANATESAPPKHKDGFARRFKGGEWEYVKDLRGTKYWMPDLSERLQSELGELPEGATTDEPENHIGETYWLADGSSHLMTALGPLPEDALTEKPEPTPLTPEQVAAAVASARQSAYRDESDPLFFKWQRGEATKEEWLDKVAEIKARYPDGVIPS